MTKTAHIIGNGESFRFHKPAKGIKMTCNVPPMEIDNVYATAIVDFKSI